MMTDEILLPFARAIYAKARALDALRPSLSSGDRARFRESISDDIKKVSNFVTPEVSEAAYAEAKVLDIDLRKMNWHDQPTFDAARELFHFEHVQPVSAIRSLCETAESEEAVLDILKTKLRVAWILKTEDAELTRLGYRHKRCDPDRAYGEAKIVVRPR
jgi:hypothetical protein